MLRLSANIHSNCLESFLMNIYVHDIKTLSSPICSMLIHNCIASHILWFFLLDIHTVPILRNSRNIPTLTTHSDLSRIRIHCVNPSSYFLNTSLIKLLSVYFKLSFSSTFVFQLLSLQLNHLSAERIVKLRTSKPLDKWYRLQSFQKLKEK